MRAASSAVALKSVPLRICSRAERLYKRSEKMLECERKTGTGHFQSSKDDHAFAALTP